MNKLLPLTCLALLASAGGHAVAQSAQPAMQETKPVVEAPQPPDEAKPASDAKPAAAKPGDDAKAAGARQNGRRDAAKPTAMAPAKPGEAAIPAVTVQGSRANDIDLRRMSTASKMIFGREELDRNGDSSVGEILKRLPGVTMGGRPGRGGEVRMRGLGSGYTQMLVNGERPPAGFSLDSLSPDQVERIEVIRGPVAEHSTQAIAGTINIVLREGYQQKDIQLKLTDGVEQNRHAPNVSLTMPGKSGGLTYLLTGSLFRNRQHDESVTHNQDVSGGTLLVKDQLVADTTERNTRGIHLTPRLQYKFDSGDTLTFQPFLMSARSHSVNDSLLAQSVGQVPAEYAQASGTSDSSTTFLRGFGNWVHKMDAGAKLDMKFGFGAGKNDSESLRNQYGANGTLLDHFYDSDSTRDHGATIGGKYTSPIAQGHLLAAGWDAEMGHRTQRRVSLDNGAAQFADSGANLTADTRRFSGFVQDEWDITPQWGVYVGLRWEGIHTKSDSATNAVSNSSSVWSPVLHAVWRIPGYEKDQVRASLTQSYKAPTLNDLIAAPTFSQLNSATRPDRTGNPQLKPELAKGIDLAYEHYLGRSGILSTSAFGRRIDNLIRREVTLQNTINGPRWVSTPGNIGQATTAGIELEAKFQLAELVPDAPNLDFRSNYSHFWSHVDGIPGPDNRLDQQAKQTANLGLDYRMKGVPLTLGGSLNWTPAIVVQTSSTELTTSGAKRQVDLYGLWKVNPTAQIRLSANNLLHSDYDSGRSVTTGSLVQMADTVARTYTTWSLKLELKL